MGRYGLPLEIVSSELDSAPSSPGSQDGKPTVLSYQYLLQQARKEQARKAQQQQLKDPYMLVMEGYTSQMTDNRVTDSMLYSTVGDSRWGGGVGGLADQDDSEGWLRRQQALQQRWRDEDSAAAQDILAVAERARERMKVKLARFKTVAAEQQTELQRKEAEEKAAAAARLKQAEEQAAAEKQAAEVKAAADAAAAAAAAAAAEADAKAAQQRIQESAKAAQPDAAGGAAASKAKQAAGVAPSSTEAGTHVQVSKRAWEAYQSHLKTLEDLTSGNAEYKQWAEGQRAMKITERDTRKISRALNAIINGLAGTQEDVADKFTRMQSELSSRSGPARTEVLVQFARKVVNQCSEMVAKSPQYAWPLAALVVQVASGAPELMDILLAVMQMGDVGCGMCVPMYTSFKVAGLQLSVEQWKQRNGYREEEEEADFLMRVSGTLRLLGALWVNHDIARAWAFVTAMLNAVPANRTSASALLAFLQTAGNALCHTYGRQAFKLLRFIEVHWLPALEKIGQSTAAERSQLRLFCSQGWREVPEGSQLVESVQDVEACDVHDKHRSHPRGGRHHNRHR